MAPVSKIRETPKECFQRLRQCFDIIKEKHADPWCWHEYLDEANEEEIKPDPNQDEDDPEMASLRPKVRKNVDRLKSHLLACCGEMQRASAAADQCFFHMSTEPSNMKKCVIVLGTAGDIDESMLESGDVSPHKLLAMMQEKLDKAYAEIDMLNEEINSLKGQLADSRFESEVRWRGWQASAMLAEETITRLNSMTMALNESHRRETALEADNDKLRSQLSRAARLMIYKGKLDLRIIFKANKKENMFYAFHGFCNILKTEKEERIRRENEARRDAIAFALKNEIYFLVSEAERRTTTVESLVTEVCRLKTERRELACRTLYKQRAYEPLEYCLWAWELWQPVRKELVLEKSLEVERSTRAVLVQQLAQATMQLPPLMVRIDGLKTDLAQERIAHDISRKSLIEEGSKRIATILEHMRRHRTEEMDLLTRMHVLECLHRDEKIAVLEREIAEDKHIGALKGMVLDLEGRLRKAVDRRKPKHNVVPPGTGMKCSMCQREMVYRSWKTTPKAPELAPMSPSATMMVHSASDTGLNSGAAWKTTLTKDCSFAPVWRM